MGSSIAFLSNYKSLNLGNHALTATIYDLLGGAGTASVLGFHRLPESAKTLAVDALRTGEWNAFMSRLRGIADRSVPEGAILTGSAAYEVSRQSTLGGFGTLRRDVAGRIAALSGPKRLRATRSLPKCGRQLRAELDCAASVYNPAGEIHRESLPLMRFVELGVAIDAGRPIGAVNFSFEPGPVIAAAAGEVFPAAQAVYVRDRQSRDEAIACGAPSGLTEVVPDAVFLVRRAGWEIRDRQEYGRVGIAVNGTLDSALLSGWIAVIRDLQAANKEAVLISNEHGRDEAFLSRLAKATGARLLECTATVDDYLRALQDLDAVVSSRFHTCVLALIVGVPVVPVEGASHRIRGGLETVGLRDVVVGGVQEPSDLARAVLSALDRGGARLSSARVEEIGQEIRSAYARLSAALASH